MGCISDEWRQFLIKAFDTTKGCNEGDKQFLNQLLSMIPSCEKTGVITTSAPKKAGGRALVPFWPSVIYHDENGQLKPFDSITKFLPTIGGAVTGANICDPEGRCGALSVVENVQFKGYIVMGDGEKPPSRSPGVMTTAAKNAYEQASKAWKEHLTNTGKKIHIYHPNAPELRAVHQAAEAQSEEIAFGPGISFAQE